MENLRACRPFTARCFYESGSQTHTGLFRCICEDNSDFVFHTKEITFSVIYSSHKPDLISSKDGAYS